MKYQLPIGHKGGYELQDIPPMETSMGVFLRFPKLSVLIDVASKLGDSGAKFPITPGEKGKVDIHPLKILNPRVVTAEIANRKRMVSKVHEQFPGFLVSHLLHYS